MANDDEDLVNGKGIGGRVGDWQVRGTREGGKDLKDPRELARFRGDFEPPTRPEDQQPNPIRDLWEQRKGGMDVGPPLRMIDESCTTITPPMEVDNPITGGRDRLSTDSLPVADDVRCTPAPSSDQYGDYVAPAGDQGEA